MIVFNLNILFNIHTYLKMTYSYIIIRVTNVNHTAIYQYVQNQNYRATDTFDRLFYEESHGYKKDLTSREHDEVICLGVRYMGLRVTFREKTSRRNNVRYAIIYNRYKTGTEDEKTTISALRNFIRCYQRIPEKLEVISSDKLPDTIPY